MPSDAECRTGKLIRAIGANVPGRSVDNVSPDDFGAPYDTRQLITARIEAEGSTPTFSFGLTEASATRFDAKIVGAY